MASVVISGAAGRTGRRLEALLSDHPGVDRVTTVDASAPVAVLKAAFAEADALVHLGLPTTIGAVHEAASSSPIISISSTSASLLSSTVGVGAARPLLWLVEGGGPGGGLTVGVLGWDDTGGPPATVGK